MARAKRESSYFFQCLLPVHPLTGFPHAPVSAGGKETQHDVWKYNGALDKWIQIEPLTTGRWRHKMAVHGGKVYALGGFDGVQRLASVEAYDPFHNRWTQVRTQEFNVGLCGIFTFISTKIVFKVAF